MIVTPTDVSSLTVQSERVRRAEAVISGPPRVVYLAHPIRGAVDENIRRVRTIERYILNAMMPEVYPIAPYLPACEHLPDTDAARAEAFKVNERYFSRHLIDELWVTAPYTHSAGVLAEMRWALQYQIDVKFLTFDFLFNEGRPA